MGAGSGPLSGAGIIHHGADEQLIYEDSIPHGEITLPTQEETHYIHPMRSPLSHLINVRRPGESCMYGYHQITNSVDPCN